MTSSPSPDPPTSSTGSPSPSGEQPSARAHALADRLEEGARALASFAATLTEAQWHTRIPGDGRPVGVVVHHVASVYPLEIQLAQTLARGQAVVGVTMDAVHEMNATHATEHDEVTKEATLALLARNSAAAAAAIRALRARSSIARLRHRSTPTLQSPASSCSRTTPSGTVITISPGCDGR